MSFVNPHPQHLIKSNHNHNKKLIVAVVVTFLCKNCTSFNCRGNLKAPIVCHQKLACGSISRQCKSGAEGKDRLKEGGIQDLRQKFTSSQTDQMCLLILSGEGVAL